MPDLISIWNQHPLLVVTLLLLITSMVFLTVLVIRRYLALLEQQGLVSEHLMRLQNIISASNFGTWVWNVNSGEATVDDRWADSLGYKLDELPAINTRTWMDLTHADDLKEMKAILQRHLDGETEYYDVTVRMKHKAGHWVWVHDVGQVTEWSEDGSPLVMYGMHTDISEQKREHEQLQKFSRAVEQNYSIVFITDRHANIEFVNPAFTATTGFTMEEVVGTNPTKLPAHLLAGRQYKDIWEIVKKKELWQGEIHNQRKDGTHYWARTVISPIKDDTGEITHYISVAEDITEQKKAEEQLHLAASVFEHSQECIIITDTDKRIIDATPACAQLNGYLTEELIGATPDIFRSNLHDAQFYKKLWLDLESGQVWRGVFRNRHKDGHLYWEENSISQVKSPTGEVTHYVAIKRDVTQQEAYLNALRQAKQEAQAASRAKSDFLANISHEIRTPMNAILGFAELGIHEGLAPKYRSYIENIQKSVGTMLALIDDLLDFSKIEAGKLQLESIAFDVNEELSFVSTMMQEAANKKNLALQISYLDGSPLRLLGDPLRLKQVLINLITNAVKFSQVGRINVLINIVAQTDTAVRLTIEVCDTGIGISQEEQINLFHVFSQADTSTTRKYGGTGLGLSISKELVKLMGGVLEVESEKGIGSTFYFDLILPIANTENETIKDSQEVFAGLAGSKILVVDDDELNQQVVSGLLERRQLSVEVAGSGQEAIDKLAVDNFDLVLMDIQMPIMDGYETSEKIRKLHQIDELPIIALTANAMPGIRDKCLRAGMNDYVTKPIDSQVLLNKIKDLLESHKPGMLPLDLQGIDVKQAMQRLDIDWSDYTTILTKFAKTHKNDIAQLVKKTEAGKWDDAGRVAHILTSLAGTIGATELFRLSSLLEHELRKYQDKPVPIIPDTLSALLADTDTELRDIVSTLEQSLL